MSFSGFVTLGTLLNLTSLQFLHLKYGHSNSTSLTGLLGGLDEVLYVKSFAQDLAYCELSINVSYHY